MELIVVNSLGPMGSSLVSSVLEKFGYINLPIRKRKLEEYILDNRKISDNYFKKRTIQVLNNLSKNYSGGLGVLDRNNNIPTKKIDVSYIQNDINKFLNKDYDNIQDLYFDSMILANKGTVYKNKIKNVKGAIEQATYFTKFDNNKLRENYLKKFNKVRFISLQRDFIGWINSLLAQKICEKNRSFFPHLTKISSRKKQLDYYNKIIKQYDATIYDFNEVFKPNTDNFLKDICNLFGQDYQSFDWENIHYDLYGSIRNFNQTFIKFDDKINYLSPFTKVIANRLNKNKNKLITDIIFQVLYAYDYLSINSRLNRK